MIRRLASRLCAGWQYSMLSLALGIEILAHNVEIADLA